MPRRKPAPVNPVVSRPLTPRQKKFAEEIVLGRCSNTEAARRAGYAESSAGVRACELLDIGKFPHVANYINELRLDLSKKYEITSLVLRSVLKPIVVKLGVCMLIGKKFYTRTSTL